MSTLLRLEVGILAAALWIAVTIEPLRFRSGIIAYFLLTAVSLAGVVHILRYRRRTPVPLSVIVLSGWGTITLVFLLVANAVGASGQEPLFVFRWPNEYFRVRSLVDVFVVMFAFGMCAAPLEAQRRSRGRIVAGFTVVAALVVASWSMKMGATSYIALWAPSLPESLRFWIAFDLFTSLWLGVMYPVAIVRDLFPERAFFLCSSPLLRPGEAVSYFGLTAVPLLAATIVNLLVVPGGVLVDTLSAEFWTNKGAAVLLWTATYEELTWRVVLLIAVLNLGRRTRVRERALVCAACIISGVTFGAAHLNSTLLIAGFAMLSGSWFAWILVRTRRLEYCVLGHWLVSVMFTRWN